jgi:Bacterial Ig domain/FG-GAP-like repeat/Putative Ig domain
MAWNLFGTRQPKPFPSARPCLEVLEDRVVLSAPVLTLPSMPSIAEGNTASAVVSASNPNNGTLTYLASALPIGLSINPSSGLISGRAAYDNTSDGLTVSLTANVTVSDGVTYASSSLIWTVTDTDRMSSIANQSTLEGGTYSLSITTQDNTGTNSLTYSASGLPQELTINPTSGIITGILGHSDAPLALTSIYTPTVTLTDNHDGIDYRSFSYSVSGTWYVTLTTISNQQNNEGNVVSLSLEANISPQLTYFPSYIVSNLPPGLSDSEGGGLITGTIAPGAANSSPYLVTVAVQAGPQYNGAQTFTWNVASPVTLGPVPTLQNNEGDVVSFHIMGTDSSAGSTLTYSVSGLPTGLSINSSTGLISGTIAAGDGNSGSYTPTVKAMAGQDSQSLTFLWDVASRVTMGPLPTQQNTEGNVVSFQVKATDSLATASLTYSESSLPTGLAINSSTGLISGTIAAGDGNTSSWLPTIKVGDGTSSVSQSFIWDVASRVTLGPIPTQQNNEGSVVSLNVQGTDALATATLTYSASGLPGGLTINSSTGLISGTIAAGDGSSPSYTPTITAGDGTSSVSQSFIWDVASRVTLGPIPTQQNTEGNVVSLAVKGSDAIATATLTYSQSGLPTGLAINASTGLISGTIAAGAGNSLSFTPTITASDGTSSASESFTWNVASRITLGPLATLQNNEGDSIGLHVKATDSGTASLTYYAGGLPPGLTINSSTGLISGTIGIGSGNAPTYTPTIAAYDGAAYASETFNWNVASQVTIGPIGTLQNNEGNVVSFAVKATGGTSLTYTAAGLPNGLTINLTSGLIAGTIATGAGNATSFVPVVTVNDGTDFATESFTWNVNSPLSIGPIGTLQNNEGNVISYTVKALDGTASLTFTAAGLPNGLTINETSGLISGTIATGTGNVGFFSPVVTVTDGTDCRSEGFSWNVNSPLSIGPIGTLQNNEGNVVSYTVKALDGTASLTYTAAGLPNGLTINSTTGLISGTIAAGTGNFGAFAPVVTVTDGTDIASEGFSWNVNAPLSIGPIGTLQNNEGNVVSYTVKALDGTASLTYTAAGLPNGLSINPTTGLISGTIAAGAGNLGAFAPTITVTDGTDSASEGFSWNVNASLSIGPIGTLQNNEGNVVSYTVKALDGTASLTYTAAGLPNGLSINSSTGLISGTIATGAGNFGVFSPVVTVTDGTDIASEGFGWNINAPLSIGPIGTLQNNEGNVVSYAVKALDGTANLTYTAAGLPNGLSINGTSGLISGTIAAGAGNLGAFSPLVTVTDGTDIASEGFSWNVNAPLSIGPIGTLQNNEGNVVSYAVKALDGTASLTYTAAGLPNGLSINATSGLISGTIAAGAGNLGAFAPTVTVTDGTDSASEGFTWNVNAPLSIGPIGTLQNNEGNVVSYTVKALDGTASLTYTAAGLPNGLSINASTGLISGTIAAGAGNLGAFAPAVTVTDGTDSSSEGFTWNVNSPITVGLIANQQNSEGNTISLNVKATDSVGTATMTYSAAGLPNGLSISATSGLISGTIAAGAGNLGAFAPTITVTDGTDSASVGFTWSIASAITISGIAPQRNAEGSTVSLAVSATDANSLSLTYSAADLPNGLSINVSSGLISGTIAAGADNMGAFTPVITVEDGVAIASASFTWNIASAITIGGLFTQQSSQGSTVSLQVSSNDANSLSLTYSASGLPNGLSISPMSGLISGTIAAGAANNGAFAPVVTVEDGIAMASVSFTWNVISAISIGVIGTKTNTEGNTVSLQVSATDANTLSMTYSASGLPNGLSISPTSGLISGTIAAGAGNSGAFTPVITVQDGTAVATEGFSWNVLSAVSITSIANQQKSEGNTVSLQVLATDADSLSLTYSASGLPNGLSISPTSGLISGTIAAGAGNMGAFTPLITVEDGTAGASTSFTFNVSSAIALTSIANQLSTVGNTVSLQVSASDASSLSLTYSTSGLPTGLSINPTSGLISGTIVAGVGNGAAYTPTIGVTDGTSNVEQSLTWNIGPLALPDSYAVKENTTLSVAAGNGVLANDTAPGGTTLTASLLTKPPFGTLSLASNGSFTYIPNSNWFGTDSFFYEASDGAVDSPPVQVTIQVNETIPRPNNDFRSVATGDFNGDGNLDFVAANFSNNKVWVFLGNGDGTFQTPTSYNVGQGPLAVAVGNFGNNAEDIVVANSTDGTVTILLNNGTGSFTTSQTLTVGTDPTALALGDFEGNGRLDLAVVNTGSNTVSVFLNNGTGTFTLDTTLTVGTSPSSVAAADLNNDGNDDLVVANSGSNNISVLLSNGNGTFASPVNYSMGSGSAPTAVVAADFNGDGNIDVAVANGGANTVSVLLGNGNGTLGTATSYSVGSNPIALTVGYVDGDGMPDIIVANHGSNTESNLANSGFGSFVAVQQPINWGGGQDAIALADFTNNGAVDQITDYNIEIDFDTITQSKQISLASVKFMGGISLAVSDAGNKLPTSAQWTSNNNSASYVYQMGHDFEVSATFNNDKMNGITGEVKIEGYIFDNTAGRPDGNKVIGLLGFTNPIVVMASKGTAITINAKTKLGAFDNVTYFDKLEIKWIVSTNGGAMWSLAGISQTRVYITWGDPTKVNTKLLVPTILQIGCQALMAKNVDAQTKKNALPGYIWNAFELNTKGQPILPGILFQADSKKPLQYWGKWNLPSVSTTPKISYPNDALNLVKTLDGNCVSWSELFKATIEAQGLVDDQGDPVTPVLVEFLPDKQTQQKIGRLGGILVGKWKISDDKAVNLYANPYHQRIDGVWTYAPARGQLLNVSYTAVPGQNNESPRGDFANHIVVKIGDTYYDPSYGTIYNSVADFENRPAF